MYKKASGDTDATSMAAAPIIKKLSESVAA